VVVPPVQGKGTGETGEGTGETFRVWGGLVRLAKGTIDQLLIKSWLLEFLGQTWLLAATLSWGGRIGGYHFVYVLQSTSQPLQLYVGVTADLVQRLRYHNTAGSPHTSKFGPWKIN
jgi:hypothetical protein